MDKCSCGTIVSKTPSQAVPGEYDYVVRCHNATLGESGEFYVTASSDSGAKSKALANCTGEGAEDKTSSTRKFKASKASKKRPTKQASKKKPTKKPTKKR